MAATVRLKSTWSLVIRRLPGLVGAILAVIGAVFLPIGILASPGSAAFVTVGSALLLAGIAGLAWAWREVGALRDLVARGRIMEAETTGFRRTRVRIGSAPQYRLTYAFTGPDGRRRVGLGGYAPAEEVILIDEGKTVHVIVDPENPDRFALARDVLEGAPARDEAAR